MNELKILGDNLPCPRGGCNFFQYDKGKYIIIGGVNRQPNSINELADFWTLHLPHKDGNLAGIWQELTLENQNIYTPRSSQQACMGEDGNIYIFGGQKFLDGQSTDEFYCINLHKKMLTIQPQKNRPKGRNSHSLNYFQNHLYLFGGANEDGPLSDLQKYSLESQTWTNILGVTDQLLAREMHTAHIISIKLKQENKQIIKQDVKFVEIGLIDDIEVPQEPIIKNIEFPQQEHSLEDQDLQQQQEQQQQQQQQGQEQEQAEEKGNYLVIIGGRHNNQLLKDIQLINLRTFEVSLLDYLKTPLCAHTSLIANEDIYIFGGFDGTGLNKEIQAIVDQKIVSKGLIKQPLMASCALFSKEINKIVVFGGCNMDSDLNSTYIIQI